MPFTARGASDKIVGTRFIATSSGTASGVNRVQPIICSAWNDASTNALNATITGEPALNNVQVESVQGEGLLSTTLPIITKAITVTTSTDCGQIPPGFELLRIWATVTGGTGVTGFTLGTTSSGTQILTSTSIAVGDTIIIPTGRPASSTALNTIYSNATSLGGGALTIYMRLLRII